MEEAHIIINVDLKEVVEGSALVLGGMGEVREGVGEQCWVNGIHHVVLEGVRGQGGLLLKEVGNVTSSFSGSTEESRAGGPSHLEGSRHH